MKSNFTSRIKNSYQSKNEKLPHYLNLLNEFNDLLLHIWFIFFMNKRRFKMKSHFKRYVYIKIYSFERNNDVVFFKYPKTGERSSNRVKGLLSYLDVLKHSKFEEYQINEKQKIKKKSKVSKPVDPFPDKNLYEAVIQSKLNKLKMMLEGEKSNIIKENVYRKPWLVKEIVKEFLCFLNKIFVDMRLKVKFYDGEMINEVLYQIKKTISSTILETHYTEVMDLWKLTFTNNYSKRKITPMNIVKLYDLFEVVFKNVILGKVKNPEMQNYMYSYVFKDLKNPLCITEDVDINKTRFKKSISRTCINGLSKMFSNLMFLFEGNGNANDEVLTFKETEAIKKVFNKCKIENINIKEENFLDMIHSSGVINPKNELERYITFVSNATLTYKKWNKSTILFRNFNETLPSDKLQKNVTLMCTMGYIDRYTKNCLDDDWLSSFVELILTRDEFWDYLKKVFSIFRNHGSLACVLSFETDYKIICSVKNNTFDKKILSQLSPFMKTLVCQYSKGKKEKMFNIMEKVRINKIYKGFYIKNEKTISQLDDIMFLGIKKDVYRKLLDALEEKNILKFVLRMVQVYILCVSYNEIEIKDCGCEGILCGKNNMQYTTLDKFISSLQNIFDIVFLHINSKIWFNIYTTCLQDFFTLHKLPKKNGKYILGLKDGLDKIKHEIIKKCNSENERTKIKKTCDLLLSLHESTKNKNKEKIVNNLEKQISSFFREIKEKTRKVFSIKTPTKINSTIIRVLLKRLFKNLKPRIFCVNDLKM